MHLQNAFYRLTLFFVVLLAASNSFSQTNYYVDAVSGSDGNAGTSSAAPYKNLSKLYNTTLTAGSRIYLKAGSIWTGQQLKFKGSGTSSSPIIVDKYGTGAKPIIHGNGLTGQGVVYLYNQEYIEINNLEITNSPNSPNNSDFFIGLYDASASPNPNPLGADRRGVMVAIDNYGTADHIYLKNLDIHHIKGQLGSGQTTVNGAIPKRTGGIYFAVLDVNETTSKKSRFNDVKIDSCNVYYCENMGLAFDNEWNVYYPGGANSSLSADRTEYQNWYDRRFSNVLVRNNVIHHIGKNAMIIRCTDSTGLIEQNVCYETALGTTGNTMFTARAKGTVFQYNEGYYNRSTTQNIDPGGIDGCMYDPDFGSVGIIFQYSYSHDNSEGIYWGCNTRGSNNNTTGIPDPGDVGCTLRYCISENDLGDLVYFNYPSAGNEIYNNVFYIKSGISPNIIHENSGNSHTYNYYNNIIYNLSSANSGADYAFGTDPAYTHVRNISNNIFYGNHHSSEPSDPFKLISDPKFVSPGNGGIGLTTLDGYKLKAGSPALNSGKLISNNGGLDFWGNAVSSSSVPNRGAYQGTVVGTPVINSFSPTTGTNGTVVQISGQYFTGITTVSFGGTSATSFTVVNDSTISATVASGTTGKIVVSGPNGSVTSANNFTYCSRPPAPSASGTSVCQGSTASLSASGQGTLRWYSAASGGILLATGASYTTPILSATTTYYVQDSTCLSGLTRTAVTVTVLAKTFSSSTVNSCSSYAWRGNNYTSSGTYVYNYNNADGCPSADTLYLTINQPTLSATSITSCESFIWHGTTYTTSGTYIYNYSNAAGCPSSDTLKLTIRKGTFNSTTQTACDSLTWNGSKYFASGTYLYHYLNTYGCSSTDTLQLTIKTSSSNVFRKSACSNYVWHGITYTQSGTYFYYYTNADGCPSKDILYLKIY